MAIEQDINELKESLIKLHEVTRGHKWYKVVDRLRVTSRACACGAYEPGWNDDLASEWNNLPTKYKLREEW